MFDCSFASVCACFVQMTMSDARICWTFAVRLQNYLQKADFSCVCLRTWSIRHKAVSLLAGNMVGWWGEYVWVVMPLPLRLCLVHYCCVCVSLCATVCVCCSAPAEGRTVRPWSAWCRPPGTSWGFWINTFPPASPCITVLIPPHPVAWLWAIYGISMD